jgi:O-methyltransferase domain
MRAEVLFNNKALIWIWVLFFLQWILTTWTNDECVAIMKNCYEALPDGGKLIAC